MSPSESVPSTSRATGRTGGANLRVEIVLSEPLGAERLIHCAIDAQPVLTDDVLEIARDIDATTAADLTTGSGDQGAQLIGRVEPSYAVPAGTIVDLGVEVDRLQFFDLQTGATL